MDRPETNVRTLSRIRGSLSKIIILRQERNAERDVMENADQFIF